MQNIVAHLFARAAFGLTPLETVKYADKSIKSAWRELVKDSVEIKPLVVTNDNPFAALDVMELSKEEKQNIRNESKEQIKQLNKLWIDRMIGGLGALREKMTLFWHGHFACVSQNVFFAQNLNNTLRKHALGNFGELLLAVSKDPAMLAYLNNQQNRKESPNENFAREVMELFTLGAGHYTENDIKNAARAFTGWGFTEEGVFVFRERYHDVGEKEFFGQKGNFNGEEILKIILAQTRCAEYLSEKICRFFVSDKPDPVFVKSLANSWFKSGYDISVLLDKIFTSDYFLKPENFGNHVKSPIELIVMLCRQLSIKVTHEDSLVYVQKMLGQILFFPPNVAGWPSGQNWIDSSTLMFRMSLPEKIYKVSEVTEKPKADGDINTDFLAKKKYRTIEAVIDWTNLNKALEKVQDENMTKVMVNFFLSASLSENTLQLIKKKVEKAADRAQKIQLLAIALVSVPEYQLS